MSTRMQQVSRLVVSACAALLVLAGCGSHETSAIFAAQEVIKRELNVSGGNISNTHVVEQDPPYFMVNSTVDLEDEQGGPVHADLLVVVTINPDNGLQFRWHPGAAIRRVPSHTELPQRLIAALKEANGWGTPVDWSRRAKE